MATVVDKLPPKSTTRKYNYDEWFDGQVWRLVAGVDFQYTDQKNFASRLRTVANMRRITITMRNRIEDGVGVTYVQALDGSGDPGS